MLACHPQVQARLRQEIREWLPPLNGEDTPEDLHVSIDSMPYLQAVCSEILRFYAPVPQTLREAAHDTTIADHFIPKGTMLFANSWSIHRSDEFEHPDEFIPERFLDNKFGTKSDVSSMQKGSDDGRRVSYGFGAGRRVCSGQRLAERPLIIVYLGILLCTEYHRTDHVHGRLIDSSCTAGVHAALPRTATLSPQQAKIDIHCIHEIQEL